VEVESSRNTASYVIELRVNGVYLCLSMVGLGVVVMC